MASNKNSALLAVATATVGLGPLASTAVAQDVGAAAAVADARQEAGVGSDARATVRIVPRAVVAAHTKGGHACSVDPSNAQRQICYRYATPGLEIVLEAGGNAKRDASAPAPVAAVAAPAPVAAVAAPAPVSPPSYGTFDAKGNFVPSAATVQNAAAVASVVYQLKASGADGGAANITVNTVRNSFLWGKNLAVAQNYRPVGGVTFDLTSGVIGSQSWAVQASRASDPVIDKGNGVMGFLLRSSEIWGNVINPLANLKFANNYGRYVDAVAKGALKSTYSSSYVNNGVVGNVSTSGCSTLALGYSTASGGTNGGTQTSYVGTGNNGGNNGTTSLGSLFGTDATGSISGTVGKDAAGATNSNYSRSLSGSISYIGGAESGSTTSNIACAANATQAGGYSNLQPANAEGNGSATITPGSGSTVKIKKTSFNVLEPSRVNPLIAPTLLRAEA